MPEPAQPLKAQPLKNAAPPVPELSYEAQVQRAESRLGQRVGKWLLERLLGVGGMAAVYAARHRNGDRVAIKMLHPELSSLQDVRSRFLTEGYAANRVGHPGVASVRDEGTAVDGSVFLVMDLLEGETLDELCQRQGGVLGVHHALEVAYQLLDILSAAHARGVIHRDIKPENLFITLEGKVKLLDFGVARLPDSSRATRMGAALGTPSFMAPEQARGHSDKMDARTDLWAVGATLYTLFSGKFVHDSDNLHEHLYRAMTEPVPSIADSVSLPQSVVTLVDRALAFDPEERFRSAREMQDAIQQALLEVEKDEGLNELEPLSARVSGVVSKQTPKAFLPTERPTEPHDTEPPVELPMRRSRAALFSVAALGALAVLALLVWLSPGADSSTTETHPDGVQADTEQANGALKKASAQATADSPSTRLSELGSETAKQEPKEAEQPDTTAGDELTGAVSAHVASLRPAKPARAQAAKSKEPAEDSSSPTVEARSETDSTQPLEPAGATDETASEQEPELPLGSAAPEPSPDRNETTNVDPLSRRK